MTKNVQKSRKNQIQQKLRQLYWNHTDHKQSFFSPKKSYANRERQREKSVYEKVYMTNVQIYKIYTYAQNIQSPEKYEKANK